MQKLILTGNLGQDAEVRNTGSGKTVISFSLAVTEKWKDKAGVKQSKTTWFDCAIWDRENLAPYLKKGIKVLVEGRPGANAYVSNQGEAKYTLQCNVDNIEFLAGAPQTSTNSTATTTGSYNPPSDTGDDLPF